MNLTPAHMQTPASAADSAAGTSQAASAQASASARPETGIARARTDSTSIPVSRQAPATAATQTGGAQARTALASTPASRQTSTTAATQTGVKPARTALASGTANPAERPESDALTAESAALPYPVFGSVDSPQTAAEPSVWRDTTASAVFGVQSATLEPARLPLAPPPSLTENAVFQSFVLLLAATYAMLLYRNLGDVRTLLGRISRDTATGERLSEDPGGSGFSRFLNIATAIGMLFMGVVVVKYGDSLMPRPVGEMLSHGAALILSLVATLACCAVVIYQMTAVHLAGAVTLSQPFIAQLVLLKRTYFSLAVIVTSPALLLFALCPRGTGGVWFCVVAIELAVAAILYLRETLHLFISKKISILHWFLYLCTVEVFPISLLWLLAAR